MKKQKALYGSGDSVGCKEERMELGYRELRVSVFGEAGIVAI